MTTQDRRTYDVVLVSDFRFSGGNSATNATEIRAQAAAGYRTALVHLPSPVLRTPRPFSQKIRECLEEGFATLELADQPLRTRLLIIRQPTILASFPRIVPDIEADVKLLVANSPPSDGVRHEPYYDVGEVDAIAGEIFGPGVVWAPIGPVVRDQLVESGAEIRLLEHDWHNLIDVDSWAAPRTAFAADRPVIGRHSRDHRQKWPSSAEELLAAYPDDPRYGVRVLGGAETVCDVIGGVPANWEVFPFDEISPREFLAGIDFFVYFPHPGWREAFGRTVLEAIASGAVAILPHSFEPLFGSACLYCAPHEVRGVVDELYGDRSAYERRSAAGQTAARERFDLSVHARRLDGLIGPADSAPASVVTVSDPVRHLLFVTSGGGLGHLTRMLAIARRAPADVRPVFLTQSEMFGAAREAGYPAEFLPSRASLGMETKQWNLLLRERLLEVMAQWNVAGVIFDGTMPYRGLLDVRDLYPQTPFIWSRRGMWKEGTGGAALARASAFDLIVEPGEFGADTGITAGLEGNIVQVDPITLMDEEDLLEPEMAATVLGLDPSRPAALVQLSAMDIDTLRTRARLVIDQLLEIHDLQICVPHSLMLGRSVTSHPSVVRPSLYPISPYLRAFTFAVGAAGYNLFHELVRFAVPTIFVPLAETATDDQVGRARSAADRGAALCIDELTPERFAESLRVVSDPARRAEMQERARAHVPPVNGAVAAMRAIEQLLNTPATTGEYA